MPYISYHDKVIAFKIVYYGPGLSGKTTNLTYIFNHLPEELRGDMLTLNTSDERTLFFDFFPLDIGRIEGYAVRFNMYTVPGQVYYEASRRLILDGADGVAFVADSQPFRLEENIDSFQSMQKNLGHYGVDWKGLPIVLQYNKRDCPNPIRIGTLEQRLDLDGIPVTDAVAIQGLGVMETIHTLTRDVIVRFKL